jgi:hypothetical protein
MTPRRLVLGASDPEMAAVSALAAECGIPTVQAMAGGRPVIPATAYQADLPSPEEGDLWVECRPHRARREGAAWIVGVEAEGLDGHDWSDTEGALVARLVPTTLWVADHHDPGDPGYGRPPAEFLAASSLGQVISALARSGQLPAWPAGGYGDGTPGELEYTEEEDEDWPAGWAICVRGPREPEYLGAPPARWLAIPTDLVLAAAADHCLGAAYAGQCPGADPAELARWRAVSRAAFQGRTVAEVLADVEYTASWLRSALLWPAIIILPPGVEPVADMRRGPCYGCDVADQQGDECGRGQNGCPPSGFSATWPELPEAATRTGIGYVAGPLIERDGRVKYVCSGTPEQVMAFVEQWGPAWGLTGIYGDPARGFAGGYLGGAE